MAETQFVAGEEYFPNMADVVAQTMRQKRAWVDLVEQRYLFNITFQRDPTLPVIAWCGHGRAGKDEAGSWLGRHSVLRYGSSCSRTLLPFIAASRGESLHEAWTTRHQNRKYWFQFGNLMRADDPTRIARWNMAEADMTVGIRAKPELLTCLDRGVITHAVWIDNPRVEVDPTVEYTAQDCTHVVRNDGSLEEYHQTLAKFCESLGIKIRS